MLKIKNLTIQYGNKEPVVKDFNLSIKKGEIIGIVGESGSGKTTIIKSIAGALSYNSKILSGSIILDNEELLDNNGEILKKNRGKNIAMIFQDCRNTLNPIRKIGSQYVEYIQYHSNCSKEEARKKAESMLAKMKLPDPENVMRSYPHQLSGGMCQRIGIAMAMTFNPKILLADEPTSALDAYETSIIIVTHNLGVASYMSDNIIVMKDGDVIEKGKSEQILSSPSSNYTKLLLNSVPGLEERYVV
mgnify:CR=1 FL=1